MVVGVRVESENITTGKKKHCNSSYFTMVAKDINGKSMPVPGLIVDDVQGVRRFARSMQRKSEASSRSTRFYATNFKVEDYLASLDNENVKIEI